MNRYAIVDVNNVVQNICLWDGVTPWTPPPGQTTVLLQPDEWCDIGAVYNGQ